MPYHVNLPAIPHPTGWGGGQTPPALLSCVYFFWQDEECVYVGQTKNLRQRLARHQKRLPGDTVTWLPMPWEMLLTAEGFFIWLLHPRRNYQSNWQVAYQAKRADRVGADTARKLARQYRSAGEKKQKNGINGIVQFFSDNA